MDLGIAPFDLLAAVWFSRARGPLQQRMRSVHTLVPVASGRWSNFERLNVRLHLLQNELKNRSGQPTARYAIGLNRHNIERIPKGPIK